MCLYLRPGEMPGMRGDACFLTKIRNPSVGFGRMSCPAYGCLGRINGKLALGRINGKLSRMSGKLSWMRVF